MDVIYRHAALADGTGPDLLLDQTLVISDHRLVWLGHDDDFDSRDHSATVIDAGGATAVPGFVDAHSHTVLPGGSHWIERIGDTSEALLEVAEDNGELAYRAGTRWFRDVGSPVRAGRALALEVRDAWAGRRDRPYVRAAGTWIAAEGALPSHIDLEVADGDGLSTAVERQAEAGADLIKLYLDGPDPDTAPFTSGEVQRAVTTAEGHGITITAHATILAGARAAVEGGVHCIEHGHHLDADLAAEMGRRGTYLVPTLGVLASFGTFGSTTTIDRFTGSESRARIELRRETANESVRMADREGVRIAAGTDFGGGSLRANQMAWEVECLVAAGLEPWRALGAATRTGGDLLGEPGAGRIEVGWPADFHLVHGNPLEDPGALWRVWRVA